MHLDQLKVTGSISTLCLGAKYRNQMGTLQICAAIQKTQYNGKTKEQCK